MQKLINAYYFINECKVSTSKRIINLIYQRAEINNYHHVILPHEFSSNITNKNLTT